MNHTGQICRIASILVVVLGLVGSIFIAYAVSGDGAVFVSSMISVSIVALILYSIGEALDRLQAISKQISALEPLIKNLDTNWQRATQEPAARIDVIDNEQQNAIEQLVEVTGKIAKFATRPKGSILCPVCKISQASNRSMCKSCGCVFIYLDEKK